MECNHILSTVFIPLELISSYTILHDQGQAAYSVQESYVDGNSCNVS